jgi:hypothetical protein
MAEENVQVTLGSGPKDERASENTLIPLDEAIERFGETEVVGGSALTLADLRKYYPGVTVFIEEEYDRDGAPYFETIWTDITDLGGPPYPVPNIPTGDENSVVRDNGRLWVVSWFD